MDTKERDKAAKEICGNEFHFLADHDTVPEEFPVPQEFLHASNEFSVPEGDFPYDEYHENSGSGRSDNRHEHEKRKRIQMLMPIASAVAVVSLVFSSFQYDPLGNDFLNSGLSGTDTAIMKPADSESGRPSSVAPAWTDVADDAFPVLTNLQPNGAVAGYGVLNEEYIRMQTDSEDLFVVSGSAWGYADASGNWHPVPISDIEGVRYDAVTNTLTLDHYSGSVLNVNLMGNGFTIDLVGDNYLDQLLVWGFYYGGSVKITGNGSLTVNRDMRFPTGIDLMAEYSESCLMLDSHVRVEAYGTEMAIVVRATSMEKAVYYLKPLTLSGGVRMKDHDTAEYDFHDYTIVTDENGTPSKHVVFQ